jgi:hypothetical protein
LFKSRGRTTIDWRRRHAAKVFPGSPTFPESSALGAMKKGAGEAPAAEPRRFLPERRWLGERPGYVFKTGAEGLGYYRDASTTLPADAWRETFASLQREEASARERKREEARRGRQDRVDRSGIDPHDYRRGRDDRKRDRSRSRDDARDRERAEDADARAATSTARDAKQPPPATRMEKEAAALARLAARRAEAARGDGARGTFGRGRGGGRGDGGRDARRGDRGGGGGGDRFRRVRR